MCRRCSQRGLVSASCRYSRSTDQIRQLAADRWRASASVRSRRSLDARVVAQQGDQPAQPHVRCPEERCADCRASPIATSATWAASASPRIASVTCSAGAPDRQHRVRRRRRRAGSRRAADSPSAPSALSAAAARRCQSEQRADLAVAPDREQAGVPGGIHGVRDGVEQCDVTALGGNRIGAADSGARRAPPPAGSAPPRAAPGRGRARPPRARR